MSTKLLFPIINSRVVLFKGPIWSLSPNVSIKLITPEDFGLIYDKIPDEYRSYVSSKCKCITVDNIDPVDAQNTATLEGLKISFLLNYFKRSSPIVISFAVQIIKKRKIKVEKVLDLPVIADIRLQRHSQYQLRTGIDVGTITDFYQLITTAHAKHPNVLLSLERFNSSLHRGQLLDRIIDISVCLESLIGATTELKNRFCLYNSWIAEADAAKRLECFKLLGSLYDARSAIVHGATISEKEYRKKIDPISANWDNVIKIAEKALLYYLSYIFKSGVDSWDNHQQGLVLGTEARIY